LSDFLDYGRLGSKKFKLLYKELKLNTICEDVNELFEHKLEEHKNKLIFEISNLIIKMCNDPNRIKQLLINFISNANKFTKNGIILVRIDEFDGCIRITVKDSGNGMKKEILDQIGEDYMTFGNKSNQNEHGIGLGLSLCK